MNDDINLNIAYDLLFTCPEDGSPFLVEKVDTSGKHVILYLSTTNGKQKWKHTVITEEI